MIPIMIRDVIDIAIAKLAIWSLNRGYGYCREREQQPLLSEDRCAACAASDVQDWPKTHIGLIRHFV